MATDFMTFVACNAGKTDAPLWRTRGGITQIAWSTSEGDDGRCRAGYDSLGAGFDRPRVVRHLDRQDPPALSQPGDIPEAYRPNPLDRRPRLVMSHLGVRAAAGVVDHTVQIWSPKRLSAEGFDDAGMAKGFLDPAKYLPTPAVALPDLRKAACRFVRAVAKMRRPTAVSGRKAEPRRVDSHPQA